MNRAMGRPRILPDSRRPIRWRRFSASLWRCVIRSTWPDLADRIEATVKTVLNNGIRTGDIMAPGCTQVSTSGMGDAVITHLQQNLEKAA